MGSKTDIIRCAFTASIILLHLSVTQVFLLTSRAFQQQLILYRAFESMDNKLKLKLQLKITPI